MRGWRWRALGVSLALSAAACGDSGGGASLGPADCANGSEPISFVWQTTSLASTPPIPSDYFAVPAAETRTGVRISIRPGDNLPADHLLARLFPNLLAELNQLDGFGTAAPALVPFSGPIGLAESGGVPLATASPEQRQRYVFEGEGAAIFFLDLDPASATRGSHLGVIVDRLPNDYLVIEPLVPLRPATRYALVVTRDAVGPAEGASRCVVPSADIRRVLGSGGARSSEDQALARYARRALAEIHAADPALGADRVVVPLTFTTQSIVDELLEARARIEAEPPPELLPGSVRLEVVANGPVALRVRGRFRAPDFRGRERLWQRDTATGALIEKGSQDLDFLLQIPRETENHRQPFPLALYLHGLAGDLEEGKGTGNRMANAGFATIGISAVGHRSGSSVASVLAFFNLLDIATGREDAFGVVRDNFRQSALDHIETLRFAKRLAEENFDVAEPLGVADLEPGVPPVAVGVSLGGLMGTTLTAVEPSVGASVLFVGGGVASKIIQDSPTFEFLIPLFEVILARGEPLAADSVPAFFTLMQTILERGDPVNYAAHVVDEPLVEALPGATPRSTLLVQSVPDQIVPNTANEALARALHLPLLTPGVAPIAGLDAAATPARSNRGPGVTAGFFQYDEYHQTADGPVVPSNHVTIAGGYEPFLQAATFLRTWLDTRASGEGPVLIDPFDSVQVERYAGELP